jgi:CRISPR-associated protein Csm1
VFALDPTASDVRPSMRSFVTANHVPVVGPGNQSILEQRLGASEPEGGEADEDDTRRPGEPIVFTDIARLARSEDGDWLKHEMLGALKADVDHLGLILGHGLGDRVSFGRFATLARRLDLFFKGFFTERLEQRFPYVYTVFGGGDDLLLIGPWYDVVLLLRQLRQWFERLGCANPNLTFSAGLVFSRPMQPVSHLGESAEQALDRAKEHGRNQVTVGSVTMSWQHFDSALELHRRMRRVSSLDGQRVLNPGVAYRLLEYARMGLGRGEANSGENGGSRLKWRAQMSYDLARNAPLPKEGAREAPELKQLHESLMGIRTSADAGMLYVAAMLTLYQLRGGEV